ncbi:hypothetical protein ACK4QF_20170 [Proteus mirabilis]|uniref:Uncharacterized protein n=1 Tax=Proteus mirabilis TaxID=584 RepID=A0A7D6A647_PROMI|nr:hypothetical protein HZ283_14955 [Proteus mirabilis]HEH4197106.1 hypothetical protein [Proteus mirabilis]HEH4212883.1 hypothetical protein [Proteus mirabilis]HEH4265680.1 hypothetical protein [Proteus mirabilis]
MAEIKQIYNSDNHTIILPLRNKKRRIVAVSYVSHDLFYSQQIAHSESQKQ